MTKNMCFNMFLILNHSLYDFPGNVQVTYTDRLQFTCLYTRENRGLLVTNNILKYSHRSILDLVYRHILAVDK